MPAAPEPAVTVLGQGSIGRRHAGILRELGCAVTVFDPVSRADPAEGIEIAASEDDALAGADAAVVASPTSLHLEQARRTVGAGLPTLVEKPLATTAAGVAELVADAGRIGVLLAVAMNLRFHDGPATVKRLVSAGELGTPLTGSFTFGYHLPSWRPQSDYRQSYSARAELGGGILLDAIHELDYATWILGPATSVSATLARVSDLEIDVEDLAQLQVEHVSGARSTIELDYLDRSYRRGCRIVGTSGSAEWSWAHGSVMLERDGGQPELFEVTKDFAGTYRDELKAFVAAVAAGRRADPSLVSGEEAMAVLALADAARQSAEQGRRLSLLA